MSTINEKLLEEVLSLPSDQRTILIDKLIESLNVPIDKEIDQLWAEEAERRIEEIRSGKTKTIPGKKVFDEVRSRYNK